MTETESRDGLLAAGRLHAGHLGRSVLIVGAADGSRLIDGVAGVVVGIDHGRLSSAPSPTSRETILTLNVLGGQFNVTLEPTQTVDLIPR